MNKKKIIVSIFIVGMLFVVAMRFSGKKPLATQDAVSQPIKVSAKLVSDSKTFLEKNQFPANIVGDQEVKITAKSAGTIVIAPNNIGSAVGAGSLLAKIDDTGTLNIGDGGLRSLQVQQAQLSVEQAKKSYDLAKDNYNNLKKDSSATSSEKDSAKTQRDIAKLQYENATLGLNGSVDNHSIISPISGIITNKAVSVGDSVSMGQLIATVSKTSNVKIQFYVDQDQRVVLTRGQEISAIDNDGNSSPLLIQNIAISADPTTKRFLIEAYPKKQNPALLAGTITTVLIETNIKPKIDADLILPLSAINVGQNESYIFVVDNNVAKKVPVTVVNVNGETAEISAQISPETLIITNGSKLVRDGAAIVLQN
ncbi:MAG TPA: hypothetical protein DEA43_03130 [Candidatus Moranbacteria bacterium]|nr:efflux RND transporter periplasmic adaptor subunit [Candidatus Moranbacteria bacterium]HBI33778.1 hypothetical protein [Candidatus Moranbacteria bacterium]HBT45847.1 hypothetical protein [Candidatus Moranbacteria bacterium]